jgi:hypothetical protein
MLAGNESKGGQRNTFTKVEPPSIFLYRQTLGKTATSTITVSYDDNFPTGDIRTAFEYATSIWSYLLTSQQAIKIQAKWESLSGNALAETKPLSAFRNFKVHPYQMYTTL